MISAFHFWRSPTVRVFAVAAGVGALCAFSFFDSRVSAALAGFGCGPFVSESVPVVSLTKTPSLGEDKKLIVSYDVSDCAGIKEVVVRVTPHNPMPGANNSPVDIPLSVPAARKILRTDSPDVFERPLWGQKVAVQIVATNMDGSEGVTDPVEVTFPERKFFHPIARMLIEERAKLMENPDNNVLREEAANVMASIAHQPMNYRGDPVVLLALRGGAVRLILQHNREAAISVNDLLWHAATRIEGGKPSAS
ncbi:MAG: DUF4175 family protein [Alphaproteobacteria bacterium]|nr:DUF4175 family protein [Alphaproteobacteria bacterium]